MSEATDKQWFGHPRGLATLFFTELWERFSYYGMRAILVLFLVAAIESGGFGLADGTAAAIYGLYTAAVYLLALPGGWIADRLIGQRNAVLVGGVIIAAGHFSMAVPSQATFYFGLVLIVIGTGLLKPNVSAIVGDLYPEGGARRDAGFSVFYMGINLGAFLGPLVCGYLGEEIDWHLGFGAAGIGMVLGVIQYAMGGKYLGDSGKFKAVDDQGRPRTKPWGVLLGSLGALAAVAIGLAFLRSSGTLTFGVTDVANVTAYIIVGIALLYFGSVLFFAGLDTQEKKRVIVIFFLFIGAALFWSGFEQAGSSLNLFAERDTDLNVLGWEAPASWLQSVNAIFIIIFAPVFAWLWVTLGSRAPSIPAKFAYGLLLLGSGFFVIAWGAAQTQGGTMKVSAIWLIVTYFLHTAGELCLSPVGLSSVTKLAPKRLSGQMMGTWFMGSALGNLIAGLAAGRLETLAPQQLFHQVAVFCGLAGLLFLLLTPVINKLSGKVE